MKYNLDFYKNKRVFITGHTGFKGSWLCEILKSAGANVTGYALCPPTEPSLFELANVSDGLRSVEGDIRDFDKLKAVFDEARPEIVFHLAAQPIVLESYNNPRYTYETNVMGTVNILECVRTSDSVRSFLNVTTDKVYKNYERQRGYREDEPLDGFDPYSNSKSCSELVTHSYRNSFFEKGPAISTARAGNVIGGGDFAKDRIIPDCVRAAEKGEAVTVRNPHSTRPYQHVLEPLFAYLMIAEKQWENREYSDCYNVGPEDTDCVDTATVVDMFCEEWGGISRKDAAPKNAPHEAVFLKLDCSKLKKTFGWQPRWNIRETIKKTVEWTRVYLGGGTADDIRDIMQKQIMEYLRG